MKGREQKRRRETLPSLDSIYMTCEVLHAALRKRKNDRCIHEMKNKQKFSFSESRPHMLRTQACREKLYIHKQVQMHAVKLYRGEKISQIPEKGDTKVKRDSKAQAGT